MVSVIIVTYNSDRFIGKCLSAIGNQSQAVDEIIIMDNNSKNTRIINSLVVNMKTSVKLIELPYNLGYAGAASAALEHVNPNSGYILYVAPDTFLTERYVEDGIMHLERIENIKVGALSGILYGYDIGRNEPTGLIDSTGILQTWYGRWYDRDQGEKIEDISYINPEEMPSLCGTALLCRRTALDTIRKSEPYSCYDASLFMYKEDIDLSLRMRAAGFKLHLIPHMTSYHCRGWNRKAMSRRAKILSARNEIQINSNLGLIKYLYSCTKLYIVSNWRFF
jgi:GT2 family glycosyltransferase